MRTGQIILLAIIGLLTGCESRFDRCVEGHLATLEKEKSQWDSNLFEILGGETTLPAEDVRQIRAAAQTEIEELERHIELMYSEDCVTIDDDDRPRCAGMVREYTAKLDAVSEPRA